MSRTKNKKNRTKSHQVKSVHAKSANQNAKNLLFIITGSVVAVAGILVLIYLAIWFSVVREGFMVNVSRKLEVDTQLKISEEDMTKVISSMVSYVKGKNDTLQVKVTIDGQSVDFFNNREQRHIEDVRELVASMQKLVWCCAIIAIAGSAYFVKKKQLQTLAKGYFIGLGSMGLLGMIIGIIAVINVKAVIFGFHELLFDNELWIMNPALDKVVWFFMDAFYVHAFVRIGIALLLVLGVFATISVITIKKYSTKKM